jgi:DNA-binding Lrp family transcriptional regulator
LVATSAPVCNNIMTLDKEIMEVLSEDIYTTRQRLNKILNYQPKAIERALARLNEQGVLDTIKVKTDVSAGRAVNAFIKLSNDA